MDEAELARQMEKAELENAEIGGMIFLKNVYEKVTDFVYNLLKGMTTNLIWKLKVEELMMLVVEKRVERRVKLRRRNRNNSPLIFLISNNGMLCISLPLCYDYTITKKIEKVIILST